MKQKYWMIFFFFCVGALPLEAAENDAVLNDLTIVVSSCDKYKECWKPFCTLLHRYWPGLLTHNKHIDVILITNEESFSHPYIKIYQTGEDKSWADNIAVVLKIIKTKKVLYLQEDYFFKTPVNERLLKTYLDRLDDGKTGYHQITKEWSFDGSPVHPIYKDSIIKPRFMPYRTSLQPALWLTDLFIQMLKAGENPWQFELAGSIRSDKSKYDFLSVLDKFPFTFVNGCNFGFWVRPGLDFLRQEGVGILNPGLPVDDEYPATYTVRTKFPRCFKYWKKIIGLFDSKFASSSKSHA